MIAPIKNLCLVEKAVLLLFFVVFTSSFQCESSSGSGGGSTFPNVDTAMVNKCQKKASLKTSMALANVNLQYNLSKYRPIADILVQDFLEMESIHPSMSGIVAFQKYAGAITVLDEIIRQRDNVVDEERKPYITVDFRDTECENVSYTQSAITIKDDTYLSGNTLVGIPAFNSELAYLKLTAYSVKTQYNNLRICWDKKIQRFNPAYSIVEINGSATSDQDFSINVLGVITSSISDDEIAVRKDPDNGEKKEVIEIGDNIIIGGDYTLPDNGEEVINPDLEGGVYREGKVDEKKEWNAPVIYKPRP